MISNATDYHSPRMVEAHLPITPDKPHNARTAPHGRSQPRRLVCCVEASDAGHEAANAGGVLVIAGAVDAVKRLRPQIQA
jgi:hypothetical protein